MISEKMMLGAFHQDAFYAVTESTSILYKFDH